MASKTPSRMTRYFLTRPPKDFGNILAELERGLRRTSCYHTRDEVRSRIGRVNKTCQKRPEADDIVRFLVNEGILLVLGRTHYFDRERARAAMNFVEKGIPLPPRIPEMVRIAAIQAEDARKSAPKDSGGQDEPRGSSEAAHVQAEKVVSSEPDQQGTGSEEMPSGDAISSDPAMDPEPIPAQTPSPPADHSPEQIRTSLPRKDHPMAKTHVLFLTSLEYLVWTKLTESTKATQGRLSAVFSPTSFVAEFSTEIPGTNEESIQKVVDGFVKNGLICCRGKNSGDGSGERHVFTVLNHPDEFEIVLLDETRETLAVSPTYLNLIRAAQDAGLTKKRDGKFAERLASLVHRDFAGMDIKAVQRKLVGYDKHHKIQGWGLFLLCPEDAANAMVCAKGYERFEFVAQVAEKPRVADVPKPEDRLPRYSAEEMRALSPDHLRALKQVWDAVRADSVPQLQTIELVLGEKAKEERRLLEERLAILEEEKRSLEAKAGEAAAAIAALQAKLAGQ